jgi:hypothetical protein
VTIENPWQPMFGQFGGLRIIENELLVVGPFEDWSQVRSPGRARRRRAKHPQRIRSFYKPDPKLYRMDGFIVGHPAMIRALKDAIPDAA